MAIITYFAQFVNKNLLIYLIFDNYLYYLKIKNLSLKTERDFADKSYTESRSIMVP